MNAAFKQTEIGLLPTDWEVRRIGEIAKVHDGTHQTPKYVPVGIPFYSVEQVTSGDFSNTKFISLAEHRFLTRKFKIERGDVLMTRIGSIGDCRFVDWDVDASFYVSLALLKVKDADAAFLTQYSKSRAFQTEVELHSLPSAIPKKINLGPISDVLVAYPPRPEQRAIAEALGDVDELIGSLERLIAKKRDIKQAVMQKLLTGKTRLPGFTCEWNEIQLGSLGDTYGGLTGKSKQDFGSGNAQYVTFMNVMTNPVIRLDQLESVSVRASENQKRVRQGDLLFNGSSETPEEVAYCALVQDECGEVYLNSFCFGFRPFDSASFDAYFLTALIRSSVGREVMKSLAQGSTRYNISKAALKQGWLTMPPVDEQKAIAQVVKDFDSEIDALLTRLSKTLDIKLGMMQQLLTGKVRLV